MVFLEESRRKYGSDVVFTGLCPAPVLGAPQGEVVVEDATFEGRLEALLMECVTALVQRLGFIIVKSHIADLAE